MQLGTFTSDQGKLVGTINSLALKTKATFQPIEKANDKAPDYRVYAGGAEIGAAWSKTSESDKPYLSVKLDDPSFPNPIFARLVEVKDGKHQLIWSRQ
jgi:uncharacterized protein (DUF736 family)